MRWKQETSLGDPGQIDPRAMRRWLRYVRPFVRLAFRPHLEGIENLPPTGPFMLVANHSGLGNAEIVSLTICLLERLGDRRPIAAMVHPISFNSWPAGGWMRRLGAIPSTHAAADAALAKGIPVVVFPGGDHEAMRPVWQAKQVQFAGRKGFLKIARKAGVPIVPLGIRGSHYTAPVVWRSDRLLARLLVLPAVLGIKRFPLTLAGLIGVCLLIGFGPIINWLVTAALALLWLVLPISHVPWVPWTIRMTVGPAIAAGDLFPGGGEVEIDRAYHRVLLAVQELVKADLGRRAGS